MIADIVAPATRGAIILEEIPMHQWPRITVVTPSYNQGRFLRETIESVINQDYPNLEYFVVDGGSTDNSVNIIREYEDRIDWWVSEKDNGQSDALRKGFERATGDLVGWLNSDDVYFPGALRAIGRAYIARPGASLYAGGIAVGDLEDGPIKKCVIPSPMWTWLPRYGMMTIGQPSSFYSADVYRKIGGVKVGLYIRMDADLWYRLMKHSPESVATDEMIGFIRWHAETKGSKSYDWCIQERNQFYESIGLIGWRYHLILAYFRLRRLVGGNYFKSILATRRYKGLRMSEVWAGHIRARKAHSN